jgi:hypothetical protein
LISLKNIKIINLPHRPHKEGRVYGISLSEMPEIMGNWHYSYSKNKQNTAGKWRHIYSELKTMDVEFLT